MESTLSKQRKSEGSSKNIELWKRQTENDDFANFSLLDDCISEIEDLSGNGSISVPTELKQAISLHLDELKKSFDGYFPNRVISSMGKTAVHV